MMIFDKIEIVNTSISALIYGFLLLSILPFAESIALGIPTTWVLLKSRINPSWILALLIIFGLELLLTVELTQQKLEPYHIWKLVISISTFFLIFRKEISVVTQKKSAHSKT